MTTTLTRRPQATAFSIEDLLDRVRRGEVRIPDFQRPLKWTAQDVRDLFDSVYRGYPIGTLLFWRREALAASVHFGPVRIDAPSHSQALWVVDGQQRITALAGVLLHPAPGESGKPDRFALYFDLETEEFVSAPDDSAPQAHWLPLSVVLDSELLLEWLDRYPGRAAHPEQTRRAIRLGKSIREYQVPAYVVEAAEEKTLRIIFKRLNTAGNPLTQAEVFNALYGGIAGSRPSSLGTLSSSLRALEFGTIEETLLLQTVLAVLGLDFTQDFQLQLREEDNLTEVLQQTERALKNAIVFLKRDAGVAHILLLPEPLTLVLLARFFHLHPEPSARSRELLSRWLWRMSVLELFSTGKASVTQALMGIVERSEDQAIQALLSQQPRLDFDWKNERVLEIIAAFSSFSGKLPVNALLTLRPRSLVTGALLDPGLLLEQQGAQTLLRIFPYPQEPADPTNLSLTAQVETVARNGLVNHIFHPPLPGISVLEALLASPGPSPKVLRSHAIPTEAIKALRKGREEDFIKHRMRFLGAQLGKFARSRLRYDEPDRPSLQSLIINDEED